jgi:alcohol dehydrogenase class IV
MTLSCPATPTVSAAADSLVHAVEAFVAKKTNRMARLFAQEGFRQVCTHLPRLLQNLGDISRREGVMYGAFLAGIALMHSGTGPAAAMSYPLGVHYGVPHGLGGAFFLPQVVENNIRQGYWEYANLNGPADASRPPDKEAGAQKFFENLADLLGQIGIPKNLGFYGFDGSKAQTDAFVKETLDLKGALEQNPVPFGEAEIRGVISKLSGT